MHASQWHVRIQYFMHIYIFILPVHVWKQLMRFPLARLLFHHSLENGTFCSYLTHLVGTEFSIRVVISHIQVGSSLCTIYVTEGMHN